MNDEIKYMQRCLQLALCGGSYVPPNPMVGAVIVCDDVIIGEGFHQRYGEAHAEPNAIHSVKRKDLLAQSTLYVNLEPCSHYGKTPPCADLIVSSGIARVVIGTLDPNPQVAGRGVEIMRAAGIEVVVGVMEEACRELNKRFFVFQEKKRPFILLKWAQTQDGFMDKMRKDAAEAPLLISNEITRQLTHKMRSENQSILVGTTTVLLDNPSLTVRNWSGKSPIRIAIDRKGVIPSDYSILDGKVDTLIFTEEDKPSQTHLEFVKVDFDKGLLSSILQTLFKRNIHSVLVEGGAHTLSSFLEAGLWDEANIELAPFSISNGVKAPFIPTFPSTTNEYNGHKWMHFVNDKVNETTFVQGDV